jgi:hypothetical protein
VDEYEESNAAIQARHPKLLKDDTYEFEATKELGIVHALWLHLWDEGDGRRGGTSRLGVSLETHAKIVSKAEVKVKLWVVENPQNISSKSMRAHGSKFGVKTRPQNR